MSIEKERFIGTLVIILSIWVAGYSLNFIKYKVLHKESEILELSRGQHLKQVITSYPTSFVNEKKGNLVKFCGHDWIYGYKIARCLVCGIEVNCIDPNCEAKGDPFHDLGYEDKDESK